MVTETERCKRGLKWSPDLSGDTKNSIIAYNEQHFCGPYSTEEEVLEHMDRCAIRRAALLADVPGMQQLIKGVWPTCMIGFKDLSEYTEHAEHTGDAASFPYFHNITRKDDLELIPVYHPTVRVFVRIT